MSKKNSIVHIVAVLDGSGSMSSLVVEVINSLNHFIDEQKQIEGKATFTLIKFDNKYEVVFDSIPLSKVPTITQEHYFARGMTALNDAIGKTITSFTRKKNVMFVVQTDGLENASRDYTNEQIKKMVTEKTNSGWEFLFMGANIDSFEEGSGKRGFKDTMNFMPTAAGVKCAYASVNNNTRTYRSTITGIK